MNNTVSKAINMREDRLNDLFREWGQRTRNVQKLQSSMPTNQNPSLNKLTLMARLTRWFTQLTLLQNKERDIISQICDVEKKHVQLKKNKQLKRVHDKRDDMAPVNKKKKSTFWFWMLMLLLFSKKKKRGLFPTLQNG